MDQPDVAVIGAGITGLILAYSLQKSGISCLILEGSERPGGCIQSISRDGCILERGPNTLVLQDHVAELLYDLGAQECVVPSSAVAKHRYILNDHSRTQSDLLPLPRSPLAALSSPLLSRSQKLRVLAEPFFARPTSEDCSIQDFFQSRFGTGMMENLVAPGLTGVWAGDCKKLSMQCCLPEAWHLSTSSRSLILGGTKKALYSRFAKKNSNHDSSSTTVSPKCREIISFTDGLSTLVSRLSNQLVSGSLHLHSPVLAIEPSESDVSLQVADDRRFRVKKVFCCTPASVTAQLITPIDSTLSSRIAAVPHASLGILHLKMPRTEVSHPLDGFGFLVAPSRQRTILGCLFNSSIFPEHTQKDSVVLTVFCGGAEHPQNAEVENVELQKIIIAELTPMIGMQTTPEVLAATTWHRAIPNYQVGHAHLQEAVRNFNQHHSKISLLGNWLDGTSLPLRIAKARKAARDFIGSDYLNGSVEKWI